MKLMVGLGVSPNGFTTDMEIIDLNNSSNICPNLIPFPAKSDKTIGAVIGSNLIICGKYFKFFLQF